MRRKPTTAVVYNDHATYPRRYARRMPQHEHRAQVGSLNGHQCRYLAREVRDLLTVSVLVSLLGIGLWLLTLTRP